MSHYHHHHHHHGHHHHPSTGAGPPPIFPPGFPGPLSYPPLTSSGYQAPQGPPPVRYQSHPGPPPVPRYQSHPGGPSRAPPLPPTGQQTYNFQSGAQTQFQYSQCNGRKKALLIGINYIGQANALGGCVEDVRRMKQFLLGRGYREEDMVILTDDSPHTRQQPTRQNMLDAMYWLVKDARPNDSLFFHYSGHGGQTPDLDGDEEDGFDEVIYPVDFQRTSHIVDDDMHMIMVRPLPAGCRLTAVFDACHSGSALDLPYTYSTEGKLKEPNAVKGAAKGLFSTFLSYERHDLGGMFNGVSDLVNVASGKAQRANEYTKATRTSIADVISWSGCKDDQTSADAQIRGHSSGAMTDAFLTALAQDPFPSYRQLLVEMRTILSHRYSQKPQFSSSHPIDTNFQFVV